MRNLDKTLELIDNELDIFIKRGSVGSYENAKVIGELIDAAKDIYCMYDMMDKGASSNYMYDNGESYGIYADGRSYQGRDRMGRFTSRMGPTGYRNGTREEFVDHLRGMVDNAPDEHSRQSILNLIQQMGR